MQQHALIATEKDRRRIDGAQLANVAAQLRNAQLFFGLTKTYQPAAEDGQQLPGDKQIIRAAVPAVLAVARDALRSLINFVATKDETNRYAVGTIRINDVALVGDVPVTTLLWLEKQLVELRGILATVPVLPAEESWTWDAANGYWSTEPQKSLRQVDVPDFRTVSAESQYHAAQVVQLKKNVVEGTWTTVKHSLAIPAVDRQKLLDRVDTLILATKVAREEANAVEVRPQQLGAVIANYLVG